MSDLATERRPAQTAPGRMEPLARLPVFLALEGKRAIISGNGPAVAWKAELLSAAGAAVAVLAESPCEELCTVAAQPPRGTIARSEERRVGNEWRSAWEASEQKRQNPKG